MARGPAQCHGSSSPRIHCKLPSGLQGSFPGGGWERARGGEKHIGERQGQTGGTDLGNDSDVALRVELNQDDFHGSFHLPSTSYRLYLHFLPTLSLSHP